VIIDHSDLIGITIDPFKNDAPLIVDPNREKPIQASLQLLQPVRRRHQKVIEAMGGINGFEAALGRPGETLKATYKLIAKQCLRPRISERSDHDITIYRIPVFGNDRGDTTEAPERSDAKLTFLIAVRTLADLDKRIGRRDAARRGILTQGSKSEPPPG
jgi:hypothetical protein